MRNDDVSEILTNFRSYRYAAKVGEEMGLLDGAPTLYNERRKNPNRWDASRYSRIVNAVTGAVEEVLSDDQRTIITNIYLERNSMTLSDLADKLHCGRSTVKRKKTEALQKLSIALEPLNVDTEITPFDHMFSLKAK